MRHLNFTGYAVRTNLDDLIGPDSGGVVDFPVRELTPLETEWNEGCDFCLDYNAAYVVDAISVLGKDAAYNVLYCQRCAHTAATDPKAQAAEWVAPVNA